mmetsp:Transcript_71169/g.214049  ORF Transcript_71169/g.214049 Transcript_71169/m.214049 type:complete len:693 (-) Transcript_71169:200-2278(-)
MQLQQMADALALDERDDRGAMVEKLNSVMAQFLPLKRPYNRKVDSGEAPTTSTGAGILLPSRNIAGLKIADGLYISFTTTEWRLRHAALIQVAPQGAVIKLQNEAITFAALSWVRHGATVGCKLRANELGATPSLQDLEVVLREVASGYDVCVKQTRQGNNPMWQPWFLNCTRAVMRQLQPTALLSRQDITKSDESLNAWLCLVAQVRLGKSKQEVADYFAAGQHGCDIDKHLIEKLSAHNMPSPNLKPFDQVLLHGGKHAMYVCYSVLATLTGAIIARNLNPSKARESVLLNTAAAGYFSSNGAAPYAKPLVAEVAVNLQCKAPRRTCAFAVEAAKVKAKNLQAYLLDNDATAGVVFSHLLRSTWAQLITRIGKVSLEKLMAASVAHSAICRNCCNQQAQQELGCQFYQGYANVDGWREKECNSVHELPTSKVVWFDTWPMVDPQHVQGSDTAENAWAFFNLDMDSALRCFQPMAAWVKDSLNLDARNVSMMAGRGWASAGLDALTSPHKVQQSVTPRRRLVCFGMSFTENPRSNGITHNGQPKLTYKNIGKPTVAGILLQNNSGVVQELPFCGDRYGGLREAQYSALWAPRPRCCSTWLAHCAHTKQEVDVQRERALRYCDSDHDDRRLLPLEESFTREEDKNWVRSLQTLNFNGETIFTLVTNFFELDPEHTKFTNLRYPKEHKFGGKK